MDGPGAIRRPPMAGYLNASGGLPRILPTSAWSAAFTSADTSSVIAVTRSTAASLEEAPQWKYRSPGSP